MYITESLPISLLFIYLWVYVRKYNPSSHEYSLVFEANSFPFCSEIANNEKQYNVIFIPKVPNIISKVCRRKLFSFGLENEKTEKLFSFSLENEKTGKLFLFGSGNLLFSEWRFLNEYVCNLKWPIGLFTSIVHWITNPYQRTGKHNRYHNLKFSFFSPKKSVFFYFLRIFFSIKTGNNLINVDVIFPMQSSKFIKSLNFGSNLKNLKEKL